MDPKPQKSEPVRVLLVDDVPANLIALQATLEGLDLEFVLASSGEEALRALLDSDFALIVLDVQMEGLNGFETAKLIRARNRSAGTPIIFLTAYDNYPLDSAYQLGAVDFLIKPISAAVIRSKVAVFAELYRKRIEVERQGNHIIALQEKARSDLERALDETESRYRMIVESARDLAIISLDNEGCVATWNPGAERIFGYEAEEILGRHCSVFFTAGDRAEGHPEIEFSATVDKGRSEDRRWYVRMDGSVFFASGSMMPLLDGKGERRGYLKIVRDITQERRTQEALLESEQRFRLAIREAPIPIVIRSEDGEILHFSNTWLAITGYGADELPTVGHWIRAAHQHDAERAERFFRGYSAAAASGADASELRIRTKAGESRDWVMSSARLGKDRRGKQLYITAANDVTELKASREALRLASERKDRFLSMLAHELRNPLAPIQYSISLLEKQRSDPDTLTSVIGTMSRQLRHMVRMLDDLLDVSRIELGKIPLEIHRLDLRELIAATLDDMRPAVARKGLELSEDLPAEAVFVSGDPVRLTQVLTNLLNNAIRFTERGTIAVRLVADDSDWVKILVSDTGMGLSVEDARSVFETFFQVDESLERSKGGLGLGLSIVRGLVELHGGTVSCRSEGRGKGATFEVLLPGADRRADLPPGSPPRTASAGKLRILVIEDQMDAAESLAMLLKLEGHDVRISHDGESGIALALEYRPEVVICDIGLPKMNGYEVARAMRAEFSSETPVLIALSGYGGAEVEERCRDSGFDRHFVKPVAPELLLSELAALSPA